ncbi:carboxypeptidase-like regulatory domain-containing protein [Rubrivirga sp. IMCC45206]|uniref:carboxypeptidase-like regulatory domain-containing protein n=1 Tax=Rubrivirga sp. IMCC45206 TaxID=3391614 RepID=UPI00398FDC8E
MTLAPRIALAGLAFFTAGCVDGAPHENPLDPLSDRYVAEGTVAGRVTGIYPPFQGRAGARVRVLPVGGGIERVATTGADGGYRLVGLPEGDYTVMADGEGLRADTTTATVAVGAETAADLRLDALPVVEAQAARTVHIERWFPESPLFRLEVEASVTDPDRPADVDGVALVVEALSFRAALAEVAPGRYAATFDAATLPGGQVQALLGQSLRIEATDVTGGTALGPPLALVRVIEQTPLTASPQGLETVAQNPPTLTWRPAQLPFAFTYRVDVHLIDGAGIPNLVDSVDGLPASQTALALTEPLAPGDYFWTVWVTDAAGNRSRSKEAGFRVP